MTTVHRQGLDEPADVDELSDEVIDRLADRLSPRIVARLARALTATERAIGVPEAALRCGVYKETVRQAILDGRLPALRIGYQFRIKPSDLDAWAAVRLKPVPAAADADGLLTARQCAERGGVATETVLKAIRRGELEAASSGRAYKIKPAAFDDWLAKSMAKVLKGPFRAREEE